MCLTATVATWKINLQCIGDEGVEMLVRGAVEEKTYCTGGISEIKLSYNGIISEGVNCLLELPRQFINKLKTLILSLSELLGSESCAALACLIPRVPHMKILNLSDNPNIGQVWAVPLMTSLTAHNSLETLLLPWTRLELVWRTAEL